MHRVQDRRTVTPVKPERTRRRSEEADRSAAAAIILGTAAGSVALDQIAKTVAERTLTDGPVALILGARLVLTYNPGAAFSVGAGRSGVFSVVVPITIAAITAYALWVRQRPLQALAFGLIIGGAAGNLVDRLARSNGGRVIDFFEIAKWWPVFNLADTSLFCGVALLLLVSFRDESRRS